MNSWRNSHAKGQFYRKSNLHVQPHPLSYLGISCCSFRSFFWSPSQLSKHSCLLPSGNALILLSPINHPCCSTGQALENMIQVPTKSLNPLKWSCAHWATILQVQPVAHHSFPPLCWASPSPAAPRTGYSSFHFGIIQHTRCFLPVFGFKWLEGNAERRNWSKGTGHPPPAVHVLLVTIQCLTEEGLANSVFAKLPSRQDFNLQQ